MARDGVTDAGGAGVARPISPGTWIGRRAPWLALAGYVGVTIVAMWPVMSHLSNTIMGSVQPNDATTGGVWAAWQLTVLPLFASHTHYVAAPQGSVFWNVILATESAWLLPQWLLAEALGPVASWNIVMALAFVADGMAMFGLVRWLLRNDWIAFGAGVLYAFSPFHVEESYAHVSYVAGWIFPLILWAGLAMIRRPGWRTAVIFGIAVAASAYNDAYYIVFATLLALGLAVTGLLGSVQLGIRRRQLWFALLCAGVTTTVGILPLAVVYEVTSASVSQGLNGSTRSLAGVTSYSARLWEYVIPWAASPIWGRWIGSHVLGWLAPVQPVETSLYLGIVVITLSLVPLAYLVYGRVSVSGFGGVATATPRRTGWLETATDMSLPARWIVRALLSIAGVLALCSVAWFGPIPGFPVLLYRTEPYWRAFSRMGAVVDCLVIVVAAVALKLAAISRKGWMVPALGVLTVVDGTAIFPLSSWSYSANTPAPYRWLADHRDGGIVAGYPLPTNGPTTDPLGLTFQPFNGHPLFDGSQQDSRRGELQYGLADIHDRQTVPTLRTLGVRYITLDRSRYVLDKSRTTYIRGLKLLVDKSGDLLYRIEPGPLAPAALTAVAGFPLTRPFLPHLERYMYTGLAVLGIRRFGPAVPLRIGLRLSSWRIDRIASIYQNGVLLWHGEVRKTARRVTFLTTSAAPLDLRCSPCSELAQYSPLAVSQRKLNVTGFDVTRVG